MLGAQAALTTRKTSGSRAAPMATAGGMLSMLGVQAARAVTSMIQRMHIVDL